MDFKKSLISTLVAGAFLGSTGAIWAQTGSTGSSNSMSGSDQYGTTGSGTSTQGSTAGSGTTSGRETYDASGSSSTSTPSSNTGSTTSGTAGSGSYSGTDTTGTVSGSSDTTTGGTNSRSSSSAASDTSSSGSSARGASTGTTGGSGRFSSTNPANLGWYVGGSFGRVNNEAGIDSLGLSSGSTDSRDNGWKLFGGYRFHPNFGAELGYVNLGQVNVRGTTSTGATVDGDVNTRGFNLVGIGYLPLSPEFSFFGKAGLINYKTSSNVRSVVRGIDDGNQTDLTYGLGLEYKFTPAVGLRAEWERFDIDPAHNNLISVGLSYHF